MTKQDRLLKILNFVRSHNLPADVVDGAVQFKCCDGIAYRTASMSEARRALHY